MKEFALLRGGRAVIVATGIEQATIETDVVSPPGSTLELDVGGPLGLKVRSCRRLPEVEPARYRIEGRWVSLSRAQREALGIQLPKP